MEASQLPKTLKNLLLKMVMSHLGCGSVDSDPSN